MTDKIQDAPEFPYDDWMPEARQIAAQCWCDDETRHTVMDTVLAEAIAKRIAQWMWTGAQQARNTEFYRGLLLECATHLGPDVFVSDDGSIQDSPLALKIPELVTQRLAAHSALLEALKQIAKGEGAFSRDQLTHANNTIQDMKAIAESALTLAGAK